MNLAHLLNFLQHLDHHSNATDAGILQVFFQHTNGNLIIFVSENALEFNMHVYQG